MLTSFLIIATFLTLIIIGVLVVCLYYLNRGDDFMEPKCQDSKDKMIIYSYGLFSNEPMSETMKRTIQNNAAITALPYVIIGPDEIEYDLKEIEEIIPGTTRAYNNVLRGVAKSDIARMVSLYVRGGHYADLDVEFFDVPPIKEHEVIVYTEKFSVQDNDFTRIANYALSSPPKHEFIAAVIREIINRVEKMQKKPKWTDLEVLSTTGPDVITSVFHVLKDPSVLRVSYIKSRRILRHNCAGSWRQHKDYNIK
jgi:mannosyltransferase OCH1-like enzyme